MYKPLKVIVVVSSSLRFERNLLESNLRELEGEGAYSSIIANKRERNLIDKKKKKKR